MSVITFERPDEGRAELFFQFSAVRSLEEVCARIVRARGAHRWSYVERIAGGWRWSPAHRGGPYPLLRETAQLLAIDHRQVMVTCAHAGDGWSIIALKPLDPPVERDAWVVLRFEAQRTPEEVREQLLSEPALAAEPPAPSRARKRRPRIIEP